MNKLKILTISIFLSLLLINTSYAQNETINEETEKKENSQNIEKNSNSNYLKAVINANEAEEIGKSTIFDASQSFIPASDNEITYSWDFGDGNIGDGQEVFHSYQEFGEYKVKLTISDGTNSSSTEFNFFAYRKLITLITDETGIQDRIILIKEFAKKKGTHINLVESFGSSTEIISEDILTKKLNESGSIFRKKDAQEILIWTKENAGLNAISRYIQVNQEKLPVDLSQKTIMIIKNDINSNVNIIQKQFSLIKPKQIIVAQERAIEIILESISNEELLSTLKEGGYVYEIINKESGVIKSWRFMSYFVNFLINKGIPDNTIALLLLLPVIATIVAFMKQVVGITTFGIYTPSVITLSFLIIGMHAGLLTLATAVIVGAILRPILKKFRLMFIPKMAIVITIVTLSILLMLITSIYLNIFEAQFLTISTMFPMIMLSTLVEKVITVKSEKGLLSAIVLMSETVFVALIAYLIVGGEMDLGITTLQTGYIKRMIITYPELIFALLIINIGLGRWSGLRVFERFRFREIFRHIEE